MPDLEAEEKHLAKAERDIADGEERIARQTAIAGRLQAGGQDAKAAEALLRTLRETLAVWKDHRDEILRTIARLRAPAGS